MTTTTLVTAGLAAALLTPAAAAQDPVWADEFNTLDTTVWQPMIGTGASPINYGVPAGWGNNELQYYTNLSNNVRIENGELVIEARRERLTGTNRDYTSARLRTPNRAEFGYSRIEARIKIPSTDGIWPAFWMLPTASPYGGWPLSGEIDIMESVGNADRIYGTIHFGSLWPNNRSVGTSIAPGIDYSANFHVYRVDWYPDRIEWFIDGQRYARIFSTQWDSDAAPANPLAPFDHQRFHLILNVAVGGNFPGNPTGASTFPQQMRVDWVRVYELEDFQQPFFGTPLAIPGVIQAEDYDFGGQGIAFNETDESNNGLAYRRNESVDIQAATGGGFNVGWIRPGEWIEYTTEVQGPAARRFDVTARVASGAAGGRFRLEFDGVDATGQIAFGNTGGWQSYANVSREITLEPGRHVMRMVNLGDSSQEFNLERFTFTALASPCGVADLAAEVGALDINDILAFAAAFDDAQAVADISGDGATDINDILEFAAAYDAGCP